VKREPWRRVAESSFVRGGRFRYTIRMRRSLLLASLAGLLAVVSPLRAVPLYDHVVVVMLENHGYSEVLTGPAPYLNGTLRVQGANITGAFGIQHPSQPNYYWLFSGSNQGIVSDTPPTAPFIAAPNLYSALAAEGRTFGGYMDDFHSGDDPYTDTTNYAVRHVPWLGFSNVPAGVSIPFDNFPQTAAGFAALPAVSFVIPALDHDMHDYDSNGNAVSDPTNSAIAIQNGDAWLQANLNAYYQWARTNNSLLIITTDEDSTADWITPPLTATNAEGLTSPILGPNSNGPSGPNQITMIFAGAGIVPGNYREGPGVTNVNVLRTIESIYGVAASGAQSPLATLAGIGNAGISDIFVPPQLRATVGGKSTKHTTARKYRLRGHAADSGGVLASVEVRVGNGPYRTAQGTSPWNYRVTLAPGKNVIRVRAVDRGGEKSPAVKVTITRTTDG
jgi:hypothetical protein